MSTTSSNPSDEQVAAALLPVLLHRINNTTQALLAIRALIGDGDMPPRCSNDLAKTSEAAHEEGWLLGVIAGGLGADLLLARHEREGLAPVLRLVRDALRREQCDLQWREAAVPMLVAPRDASSPAGGRVCWAVASILWCAGAKLGAQRTLRVEIEQQDSRCYLRGDAGADDEWVAHASAECARLGGGARCSRDGEAWLLELPRGCAEPSGGRTPANS